MSFWHRARVAALAAVYFAAGCAAAPDESASGAAAVVAIEPEQPATPEFHGARIGADTLRSRLDSEN